MHRNPAGQGQFHAEAGPAVGSQWQARLSRASPSVRAWNGAYTAGGLRSLKVTRWCQ